MSELESSAHERQILQSNFSALNDELEKLRTAIDEEIARNKVRSLSVHLYLPVIHLFIYSIYSFICSLSILSILSILFISIYLFYLFIYLSLYLYIYLSVCLSIHPPFIHAHGSHVTRVKNTTNQINVVCCVGVGQIQIDIKIWCTADIESEVKRFECTLL